MEVILDTNFIISCVRKKIDFVEQLESQGFRIAIPREVIEEMKDLKVKVSPDERVAIDVAFRILDSKKFKKMKLGNRRVDEGLIEKGRQGIYIATLDAEIKRNVPNRVIIFDAKKSVGIDR